MIGAILAGIGSLVAGAGSAAVGLGSGIISGLGGLVTGGVSAAGSTLFGGQAAVPVVAGAEMGSLAAASAAPGGTGLVGGLVDVLASGKLAAAAGGVGGLLQVLNPPEPEVVVAGQAAPIQTPRITLPTLPAILPGTGGQKPGQIFTTPAAAAKPDYLPYIAVAALALLIFFRKK